MTPKSLRRRDDLEQELAKVRQRGYATNREENEPGVSSVSVAISDRASRLHAAVNVAAPTSRMSTATMWRVAEILTRTVAEAAPLIG